AAPIGSRERRPPMEVAQQRNICRISRNPLPPQNTRPLLGQRRNGGVLTVPVGDGIRRNVAEITQAERDSLRNAFLTLNDVGSEAYSDGVTKWFKQDQIHMATHVHAFPPYRGIAFLPWHREICNRFELLLREVDPQLSLHYWDWTTDPRTTPAGGLFTPSFMGSASGRMGAPFE